MKVVHGGNIYKIAREYGFKESEIKDFSANINPLGIPSSLINAIRDNIKLIENYPDPEYRDLIDSLSEHLNISKEYIIPGNGATELIFLALSVLNPSTAMVLAPTFGEYERALNKVGVDVSYHNLNVDRGFKVDVDELINDSKNMDVLVVCNPNNPTGQILKKKEILKLLKGCRKNNTFLFLDEAFIDFLINEDEYSALGFLEEYDNLFILRALTKFYAIPGLRLGFGITGNKELMQMMSDSKEPWSINTFADIGGQILVKDAEYIVKTKEFVKSESMYLYNELTDIDYIKVYRPSVNYVFFRLEKDIEIVNALLKQGIMIRSCSNYNNLNDKYYRVAVKSRKDNISLINALKEVFGNEGLL